MAKMNSITKKEQNFIKWYNDVINASGLAYQSPVQGCIVYSDYCLAIWKQIKKFLDERLNKLGFKEYYFPMLIPLKNFKKQQRHFDDFFKEVLVVSNTGLSKLNNKYVIRPTSEAIMYESFAGWIKEESDLPLLVNQYCSVIRWESFKPNMLLLRCNEFLWQESHSVHATEEEADKFVNLVLGIYLDLHENLAIPLISGYKPQHRMFPGAKYTLALETLMPDLKSVQSATSHSLGQNFSSVFKIKFKDTNEKEKIAWQACNGITTRIIGILVMLHGDNKGLVIPPKIAPYQVVLLGSDKKILGLLEKNGIRFIDEGIDKDFNDKVEHWILMGIPIIIIKNKGGYTLIRRDTLEKIFVKEYSLVKEIPKILSLIQNNLYKKAKNFMDKYTAKANSWKEFKEIALNKGGFIGALWCGNIDCAKEIRKIKKYSARVINPLNSKQKCIKCGKKTNYSAIFAPAY